MNADAYFMDAEQKALEHPDTFKVPTEEDLRAVEVGTMVKVCLALKGHPRSERFWVCVTKIDYPAFTGNVRNDLVNTALHGVRCDDEIEFEARHIYNTVHPPANEPNPN